MKWINYSRGHCCRNSLAHMTQGTQALHRQKQVKSLRLGRIPKFRLCGLSSRGISLASLLYKVPIGPQAYIQSHLSTMSLFFPFSDSSTSWWTRAVVTLQWGLPHTLSCIATTRGSCKSWRGMGVGDLPRSEKV